MSKEEKTYWQIICESASESTAHGVPHVFKRENWILKIFWLVCTLGSAGVCGWLVAKSIMDFNDHETVTQSKTIYEIPTLFPAVSICNKNTYTTQAGLDYATSWLAANDETDVNGIISEYGLFILDIYRYVMGVSLLDQTINDTQRKEMGLQIEDMFISCTFNNLPCSIYEFAWYFDPFFGSCYSFNSGKNFFGEQLDDKFSTKAGLLNGLKLELFVNESDNINSFSYVNGFHVLVHNKSVKPTYLQGVSANVGAYTFIAVNREFSSRLEKPYSECIEDIASLADNLLYVKTLLDANYTYTQVDCFNVCLQKYIVQECNCYNLDFPFWLEHFDIFSIWNSSNVDGCKTVNQTNCYGEILLSFFTIDVSQVCPNECPLECDSITYQTTVSSVEYPSKAYATVLRNSSSVQKKFNGRENVTLDELRESVLAINVFYAQLSYKSMTEVEKTQLIDLVSNIGGTLGLFLGVSFLSFIEIFDILMLLFLRMASSRKLKSNLIKVSPKSSVPSEF